MIGYIVERYRLVNANYVGVRICTHNRVHRATCRDRTDCGKRPLRTASIARKDLNGKRVVVGLILNRGVHTARGLRKNVVDGLRIGI